MVVKMKDINQKVIDQLLKSDEPSIRYKTRINILGEKESSINNIKLSKEIKNSKRIKSLLRNMDKFGTVHNKKGIYSKWQGAHWILITLADLGYPKEDPKIMNMAKQVSDYWLQERYYKEFVSDNKADCYKHKAVPIINGRYRTCASQQGYTLYAMLKLGLLHDNVHRLKERLLKWQWPDGGWNCDKNPHAKTSTFIHTLYCMKGLFMYAKLMNDKESYQRAMRAKEYFLKRQLYIKKTTNEIIKQDFIKLHYPLYWHYDILGALKAFAEFDLIDDSRCQKALNLL